MPARLQPQPAVGSSVNISCLKATPLCLQPWRCFETVMWRRDCGWITEHLQTWYRLTTCLFNRLRCCGHRELEGDPGGDKEQAGEIMSLSQYAFVYKLSFVLVKRHLLLPKYFSPGTVPEVFLRRPVYQGCICWFVLGSINTSEFISAFKQKTESCWAILKIFECFPIFYFTTFCVRNQLCSVWI